VAELLVRTKTVTSALVVGLALTAAGCSQEPGAKAPQSSSATSTSATTTTPAAPAAPTVAGRRLPPDLLAMMTNVYLGGAIRATPDVAPALAKRTVGRTSLAVGGAVGSWRGTPIAVVTRGNDVTLLQKTGAWTVVGGWWPSLGISQRLPATTMRVLAIGSDARPNQVVTKARADALQIIGVDRAGVGGIVGIPRDSWVPLSTGGSGKINAALVFGGAQAQTRTVERATGVPIDGYVLTGFKGFRAIVEGVGGIPYVSRMALRSSGGTLLLKVGANVLNGSTALGFARERKHLPNGDFGRSANQGAILIAAMAAAKQAGPAALPKYLTVIGANVSTNLTPAQVLNLAAATYVTNTGRVANRVAPGSVGMRDGQSVVVLGGGAATLFRDIKDGRLG
jgi:LCP family protein required for cell wall assembly